MATKAQVLKYMKDNVGNFVDPKTGEVNETGLAKDAAWNFDIDQWLDDPDHWVWEMAMKVCDEYAEENG